MLDIVYAFDKGSDKSVPKVLCRSGSYIKAIKDSTCISAQGLVSYYSASQASTAILTTTCWDCGNCSQSGSTLLD